MPGPQASDLPPLALAYVGDAVYELLIRSQAIRATGGQVRLAELHQQVVARVRAGAQAQALHRLLPLLTADETAVVRRARNARPSHPVPSGAQPGEYRYSSGLEALFGYLYWQGRWQRLQELAEAVAAFGERTAAGPQAPMQTTRERRT
ncbi:MAG: ribonuclease III [Limnochordaceae bacterium]|nr:ribonuclease III [Limnochordaceae bacterium]